LSYTLAFNGCRSFATCEPRYLINGFKPTPVTAEIGKHRQRRFWQYVSNFFKFFPVPAMSSFVAATAYGFLASSGLYSLSSLRRAWRHSTGSTVTTSETSTKNIKYV